MAPFIPSSSVGMSACQAAPLVDQIRSLARHHTASEIAFRLGLSPGEVSRICLAHGITFVMAPVKARSYFAPPAGGVVWRN